MLELFDEIVSWALLGPWMPAFLDPAYIAAVEQHERAVADYDAKHPRTTK